MKSIHRIARCAGALSLAVVLASCGGGGGTAPAPVVPPPPDARNGNYTLMAADARVYTLALDFDAKTYHVTGTGVDTTGAISEQSGVFSFAPGNATGGSGSSTTRFTLATDTVVGELNLAGATVPFVAGRKFLTSVADAAGTYNLLGRAVDTAGAPADTTIQQGEITAAGQLRTCDDSTIYDIASCPPGSVTTGTITVSGEQFTATTVSGTIPFRVMQVGADKVFLRASGSLGTTRRFIVGTPAAAFSGDTFVGGTTEPAWGTVTLTTTTFASSGTSPAGTTTTQSGSASAVASPPPGGTLAGLRVINAGAAGNFFAIRSSELGIVVAARGSATAPGFMAIGKKQ